MLIYEILKKDHEKVKQLLNELVTLPQEDDERRNNLVDQIRDSLVPHSRAEESVFYNSLRSIETAKHLVQHSYKEHIEAEALLRALQVKGKLNAGWRTTVDKLKSALEHHIAEEEGPIFDAAKQILTNEEAEMMGRAFSELKPKIEGEGFLKTTLDLIANMMPPRFIERFRTSSPG